MPATYEEFIEATLSTSDNTALTQKIVDQALLEYVRRYSFLEAALPRKSWGTPTYYFNRHTKMPRPQATTETPSTTDVAASASSWAQLNFPVKHLQSAGDIGKFAIQTQHESIANLLDEELRNHGVAMQWLTECFHLHGDAIATLGAKRPQWDGLGTQIATASKILPAAGKNGSLALRDLDNLYDTVRAVLAAALPGTEYAFVVEPQMETQINSLLQANQRVNLDLLPRRDSGVGTPVMDVQGAGFTVSSYRGVPIVPSSFVLPSVGTMPTVSAAASGADGSQTAAATHFMVDYVTPMGPSLACADVTVTPTAGQHIDLTFTTPTPTDADGNAVDILLYRVYKGTSATNQSLYGVVSGLSSADGAVTTIRDFGDVTDATPSAGSVRIKSGEAALANPVLGHFTGVSNTAGDGATFPTSAAGISKVTLISRRSEFTVVPTVNAISSTLLAAVNARSVQFSLTADLTLALRGPKYAAQLMSVKNS